jgi:hypothetical protein
MADKKKLIDFRLPGFWSTYVDWTKYRLTYKGGQDFRDEYLKTFTSRETIAEFNTRRDITPIPTFAKAAVNDIRNAIYQPMIDIVRRDGSDAYLQAIAGKEMGVDLRGASMNAFMGQQVLEELLVMGRVGIFVDAPEISANGTLADVGDFRPFLYPYKIENILSYSCSDPEKPSEFSALLLQDTVIEYDGSSGLPTEETKRFRHLWIDDDGLVQIQFYDVDDNPIDRDGKPSGPIQLGLTRIPFTLLDIGPSLLIDVCEYQIALLNLVSSDVNYALQANFPFYTEQTDGRGIGSHLKQTANPDGTATQGGQGAHDKEIKVGTTQGRRYPKDTDRPGFIHPSSEPLKASMALQDKMETDIRKLVNLAVSTLASRQSADSKSMDNRGLEAGLSYIGLKLEAAERLVTEFWSAYEESDRNLRKIATIKYPNRYSLKSDEDRIAEAKKLSDVIIGTPSKTARKELWKSVIMALLGGKVNPDTVRKIMIEIDEAGFTTADPETIIKAQEAGLVGEQLASIALGFPENEYLVARDDHIERIKRIAETQGVVDMAPLAAGSRGIVDLDDAPANSGPDEKTKSRDTTLQDTTKDRTRGKGKNNTKE